MASNLSSTGSQTDQELNSQTKCRIMHCSKCGDTGHTVRTCERNSTSNAKSHVHPGPSQSNGNIVGNLEVGNSDNSSPCV